MKGLISFIGLLFFSLTVFSQTEGTHESLGKPVNSEYSEINPIISPDGKTLYYVRCNHPGNTFGTEGSQDIWYSSLNEDSTWNAPVHMAAPFNTTNYNAILSVTPDGNKVLIKGEFKNGAFKGIGYSFCHKTKSGWSEPEKITIKKLKNMDAGLTNGAFLSNNGKVLILCFSEEYQGENNDLYVSFLEDDKTWTQPKSLGKVINTVGNEISPFLASDGITLYFSSDRKGGEGNNDIYMVKRQDDSWQKWSDLKNLKKPINSNEWDAYYSVDAAGKFAYMASEINSLGERDIVRIALKEEEKPDPVIIVVGNVYDSKTKAPLDAEVEYEALTNKEISGTARTNPEDGSYKIVLPYGENYGFNALSDGYMSTSDHVDLTEILEFKEIRRDLYLVPIEIGQIVVLNNVFFDHALSILREESFPELDRVVKFMTDNTTIEIEIGGHTDSDGSDQLNYELSRDRAKSVLDYIVSAGIDKSRITSNGYGEKKPVASNDTDEGKQMNRRVEFTVLKK